MIRKLAPAVFCLGLVISAQPQTSQPTLTLDTLLADYSRLTSKTVLRSSTLSSRLVLVSNSLPSDTNAAVAFIENHLRESGIDLIEDGQLFVRAVPVGWTNSTAAKFLRTLKPAADGPDQPRYTASFAPAALEQVLDIYAKLRSRTLLRPQAVGSRLLHLKTERDMTNEQLGYGITVLLALNGIAAVDDGHRFVQLSPLERWQEVIAAAPKPLPDVPELDPGQLPTIKPERSPVALDRLNALYLQVFRREPPWTPKPLDKLVEFYAELSDQKAASSQRYGKQPVWFDVTTPLTAEEALYAIETTLRLEGMAIAKLGTNRIGVISLGEQRRLEKEKAGGSRTP